MAENKAPVTREEFEALQAQLEGFKKMVVSKEEFTALESAVDTTLKAVINNTKTNSITIEKPEEVKKPDAPKPFTLKGVGEVKIKFSSFQIGTTVYLSKDVEGDAKFASELYMQHPDLFINSKIA